MSNQWKYQFLRNRYKNKLNLIAHTHGKVIEFVH
jgi:hypothetical protein